LAVVKNLMVRAGADFSELEKKLRTAQKNMADTAKKMNDIGNGMKNVGAKMTAGITAPVVGGFLAVTQGTRELRQDLGKLDAQFIATGHGAGVGRDMFTGFYGILGESDTAIEAVNHLAELTKNQAELSEWVTIATGVYAKFGDSLPIEGLTEAANETAKVGKVTGPLADALNWVGINEDKFNESLAACNTEAERATLITDTLSDAYTGVAAEYRKANGEVIDANEANAQLGQNMAKLGKTLEPIMTKMVQGLTLIIEAFNKLPEPVQNGVLAFLGVVAVLGPLLVGLGSVISAIPAIGAVFAGLTWPIGLAVAAVVGIIAIFKRLWDTSPKFREWARGIGDSIETFFVGKINRAIDVINLLIRGLNKVTDWDVPEVNKLAAPSGTQGMGTFQAMQRYAVGTNFHPGGLAWVGERGPELVNLPRGAQVLNNRDSMAMLNQSLTIGGTVRVEGVTDMGQLVGVTKIIAKEIEQGDRRLPGRVRVMPSMA